MRDIFFRLFFFQPQNTHPMVYLGLGIIWMSMLGVTFSSIGSQNSSKSSKAFWILLVILVPLAGMGIYLLWCLLRADYAFLQFFKTPDVSNAPASGSKTV